MTSSTIESAKKKDNKNESRFCSRCAIILHGHTKQFCEECQSILEIESALKQKKELEMKHQQQQQQQQQRKQEQQPTTGLKEEKLKPTTTVATTETLPDTTITTMNTVKLGSFIYPRSLWQEIVVPIQNVEKDSDTKTVRFAVFQHNPQQPTRFIIEERDTRYYYGGNEYNRDAMYFFEASIPDLSVEKGYVITSHNSGMDGKECNLDDKNLLKKVEVKCNCYCEQPKCEHKIALVSFLKIKRLFKQHYNNIGDLSNLLPGGETYAVFDSSKGKLVYTCLQQ